MSTRIRYKDFTLLVAFRHVHELESATGTVWRSRPKTCWHMEGGVDLAARLHGWSLDHVDMIEELKEITESLPEVPLVGGTRKYTLARLIPKSRVYDRGLHAFLNFRSGAVNPIHSTPA